MAITEFSEFIQSNLEEIHSHAVHKSFLGKEFLTWLWFVSESEDCNFKFKNEEFGPLKCLIQIEDKIVLTSKTGLSFDHSIRGGNPSQCDATAAALRHGKSVKELRLGLDIDGIGHFSFTLVGDDLSPRSLELPEVRDDRDEDPLEQRMYAISALGSALDYLMAKFMDERTGKQWESEKLATIREWIKTRAQGRDGIVH
ncbi:MAG: hypothetical protein NT027_04380 [Proteobacteria bacterium]|nr:hypothetical protein [Pseudomonadota bacterium]